MASENGNALDAMYIKQPLPGKSPRSRFLFGEERPTKKDWVCWDRFWWGFITTDGRPPKQLGRWLNCLRIKWDWFYDEEEDIVQRVTPGVLLRYVKSPGTQVTRAQQQYVLAETQTSAAGPSGLPCTISRLDYGVIALVSQGPTLMDSTPQKETFFDFLTTWGGEWIWTNISNEGPGLSWVIKSMTNGSAVWVTYGSYMKEITPTISVAWWILLCTQSGFRIFG